MSKGRVILSNSRFQLTIERLCHQLIEKYDQFEDTCIIGIQPRGVYFSNRLHERLSEILKLKNIKYGKLDITFFRDDFRQRDKPLTAYATDLDFLVENKKVILVDDVLYTGRTIQSAMNALNHYGRPDQVELLTLVDRRFNRHLPVQADYIGMTIDSLDEAFVKVEWKETDGEDKIVLFPRKLEKH